ncbi:hypothetical protein B0A48_06508 [Cryoendolithus antarcticus]|uniref:Uncharacterized protein n=1 Tax=Cryoendolithus antarcticus TaxID=1507870 RepID=A0A1V8TBM0_9PEZI|nr:hypothetical protein B0A48_06508 [Cryoendolithus antarcticus]
MSATERLSILVAIDFGTTFSSVAWASSRNHRVEEIVSRWGSGGSSENVPTYVAAHEQLRGPCSETNAGLDSRRLLQYDNDKLPGSGASRWGLQVHAAEAIADPNAVFYEWFKLDMHRGPTYASSPLAQRFRIGRSALSPDLCRKLVTDYLTALREGFDRCMEIQGFNANFQRDTPRRYIITVPAIWEDREKQVTQQCARDAGMGNGVIPLIKEPEAAGIYALRCMGDHRLQVNDTFVLCDAGGGTVDLISYTVLALNPLPKLREAAAGSGGLCGSTYLNRAFAWYIEQKLGGRPGFDRSLQQSMMDHFENRIKPEFRHPATETCMIRVNGLADNPSLGISHSRFTVPHADLLGIFRQVTDEVVALVVAQIKKTPQRVRKIVLAGGFGDSEFLMAELRRRMTGDLSEISVMAITNSRTAIVRGALLRGLTSLDENIPYPRTEGRIATRSFGIEEYVDFDRSKGHDILRRVASSTERDKYIIKQMHWFIVEGTTIRESAKIPVPLCSKQSTAQGPVQRMEVKVFVHKGDRAPRPMYKTTGTESVIALSVELDRIPPNKLTIKPGVDGCDYYVIDFDIEVTLDAASMLNINLRYAGTSYDRGSVSIDFLG